MNFAVHLYPNVRVKVTGIEADSVAQAVLKAECSVDLHQILDNPNPRCGNVANIEWDEGQTRYFLVDPLDDSGKVIYSASQWLDADGNPLVDGKTTIERKAAAADDAILFMRELLDSVETLDGIAQSYGTRTLSDLVYLQSAILKGGFVDHYPEESAVMHIAGALPSGERWVGFIKTEHVAQRESSGS